MKWIPIELVQEVHVKRKVNAFKVYCLMNHSSPGYFKAGKETFLFIMNKCSIKSKKTLSHYLNDLIELGYLGFHNNIYYIRSTKRLTRKSKWRVEFWSGYFDKWTAYMSGAIIGWLAYYQRIKDRVARRTKTEPSYQPPPSSFPVSVYAIAHILNMSVSNAFKKKRIAFTNGFIYVEKGSVEILKNFGLVDMDDVPRHFIYKNVIIKQEPDKIIPILKYSRKKKSKTYITEG